MGMKSKQASKEGRNKRENLFNLWMNLQLTCEKLLFTAWVNIHPAPFSYLFIIRVLKKKKRL